MFPRLKKRQYDILIANPGVVLGSKETDGTNAGCVQERERLNSRELRKRKDLATSTRGLTRFLGGFNHGLRRRCPNLPGVASAPPAGGGGGRGGVPAPRAREPSSLSQPAADSCDPSRVLVPLTAGEPQPRLLRGPSPKGRTESPLRCLWRPACEWGARMQGLVVARTCSPTQSRGRAGERGGAT